MQRDVKLRPEYIARCPVCPSHTGSEITTLKYCISFVSTAKYFLHFQYIVETFGKLISFFVPSLNQIYFRESVRSAQSVNLYRPALMDCIEIFGSHTF